MRQLGSMNGSGHLFRQLNAPSLSLQVAGFRTNGWGGSLRDFNPTRLGSSPSVSQATSNGGVVSTATDVIDEVRAMSELASLPGEYQTTLGLNVTVIERRPGWQVVDLGELWQYRELLFFLTWRDVKIRYKQTILGAAWAIIQPLATMLVFSLFFGRVAASTTSNVPYSLFVLAGLVPWLFFSNAIAAAGQSVVGSQNLVTKVFFPRLIIPMGAVGAGLVDFAIACGLLVLMMAWHGVAPGFSFVFIPLLTLGLVIAALGVGTLLSALTVAYRDFRHVVPFMVQLWMFATPSIYMQANSDPSSRLRYLLPLNPAYGLIANFRQAMLGGEIDSYSLAVSAAVSIVLLLGGCLYFRRVEHDFADII
jgi:lipopolysaccharide transport system permease protein